jgi:hypothetical protein
MKIQVCHSAAAHLSAKLNHPRPKILSILLILSKASAGESPLWAANFAG